MQIPMGKAYILRSISLFRSQVGVVKEKRVRQLSVKNLKYLNIFETDPF